MKKLILDACCGGKHFWFNKKHPNAVYVDNRVAHKGHDKHRPNHSVEPDIVMDFRKMDFPDKTFKLVVFDPPHLKTLGKNSRFAKYYGRLFDTWETDLAQGFSECWRVLKEHGVLIFKWSESEIKLKDVLRLFDQEPLFGHTTGSKSNTHWLCFMKTK